MKPQEPAHHAPLTLSDPANNVGTPILSEEVARLMAAGCSPNDIMVSLSLTVKDLQEITSKPEFQEQLASFLPPIPSTNEIRDKFLRSSPAAADIITKLAESSQSDKVRLSAAKDILDRAGFTPLRRIASVSFTMNQDQITLIDRTIKELED